MIIQLGNPPSAFILFCRKRLVAKTNKCFCSKYVFEDDFVPGVIIICYHQHALMLMLMS